MGDLEALPAVRGLRGRRAGREAGGLRAALRPLSASPPWRVAATTLIAYVAMVVPPITANGIDSLVRVGRVLVAKSDRSARISNLHASARIGYDGQYAYFIALDPLQARYYMDRPSYRYGRVLYPAAAWVAALGRPGALPYTLLAVNLLAIVGTVYLLAGFLRRREASPWWAAVYGFSPALLICVLNDLTEPLAYFLAACGLLLLERSPNRPLRAAGLFALAALARETTLVFPLIAAGALALRGHSRGRLDRSSIRAAGLLLLISTAPYVAYRYALDQWLGTGIQEVGLTPVPFGGFAKWPFDQTHVLVLLTVIVPGVVWLALSAWATVRSRVTFALALVAANAALFVVWLPPDVYENFGSAARALIGLSLAAVLAYPSLLRFSRPRGPIVVGALMLLTIGWATVAAGVAALV